MNVPIVLQRKTDHHYLGRELRWVKERSHALGFGEYAEAIDFCIKNQINEVDMVMDFGNQMYECRLRWPPERTDRRTLLQGVG